MFSGYPSRAAVSHGTLCFAQDPRMLEFFLYLISGIGYGFYFDLNPLETLLVALAMLGVFRGWWPRFPVKRVWRRCSPPPPPPTTTPRLPSLLPLSLLPP